MFATSSFVEVAEARRKSPEPELRVCTQNLFNFALQKQKKANPKERLSNRDKRQLAHLVQRFTEARCDVIALQEVVGKSRSEAEKVLAILRKALEEKSKRSFSSHLGGTHDDRIRNGFLVSNARAQVVDVKSFWRHNAPKLEPLGPERYFSRGPLGIHLRVHPSGQSQARDVYLVSMHLKSKANSWKDPTGTRFESLRIEMAEGVRNIAISEAKAISPHTTVLILGDRNSLPESATSTVLAGKRRLAEFQKGGVCKINDKLAAECSGRPHESQFVPLFFYGKSRFPSKIRGGSYLYQGKVSLIDEIYLDRDKLWMIIGQDGAPRVGSTGRYYEGSDHLLLWAELNW